jgi:prepilin-type N-terminal cleavage/methylation domain-containing protein
MHKKNRPSGRCAGFTLIEILIAIAIASILLAALYGVFFSIHSGRERLEGRLDWHLDAGNFLDRFGREINSAYFKPRNPKTIFTGEKKGLTSVISFTAFVYPMIKEGHPASDLMAVSYFVEESNGEGILYREVWNPYIGERFKVAALEGVKGFEISYLNGKEWSKAWDASLENRLPDAVKASIVIGEGKEIDMLFVPRIGRG